MTNPTTAAPEQQAELILSAWLERNPEPGPPKVAGDFRWHDWATRRQQLWTKLGCGAYESAVIQHLLPEGWERIEFGRYATGEGVWANITISNTDILEAEDAATPALALLSAIMAGDVP
jgi:hypothetical protein